MQIELLLEMDVLYRRYFAAAAAESESTTAVSPIDVARGRDYSCVVAK